VPACASAIGSEIQAGRLAQASETEEKDDFFSRRYDGRADFVEIRGVRP
jgi:hypothetical protein